jgi:hypothetical protein
VPLTAGGGGVACGGRGAAGGLGPPATALGAALRSALIGGRRGAAHLSPRAWVCGPLSRDNPNCSNDCHSGLAFNGSPIKPIIDSAFPTSAESDLSSYPHVTLLV